MSDTFVPTADQIIAVATVNLLHNGGISNWDGYDFAMEDYEEDDNPYIDAENMMNALGSAGADNWDWYDDSAEGIMDYRDYVEELDEKGKLDTVLSFHDWQNSVVNASVVEENVVEEVKPVKTEPVAQIEFSGQAEKDLHAYISELFGSDEADEIYLEAKENGVWKRSAFPKEYDKALKMIAEGVENPMEKARAELLRLTIPNGKMKNFLKSIV